MKDLGFSSAKILGIKSYCLKNHSPKTGQTLWKADKYEAGIVKYLTDLVEMKTCKRHSLAGFGHESRGKINFVVDHDNIIDYLDILEVSQRFVGAGLEHEPADFPSAGSV